MTVPRGRRAPRHSLLATFSLVVLLLLLARFGLLQCGPRYGRPSAEMPHPTTAGSGANSPAPSATASSPVLRGSEASILGSVHVALGTPHDADPSDEYFLDQRAFVLSYSPEKRVPNWVAWQLDRTHFGNVGRKDDFRSDLALPARFYRVKESDYLHSGYDRGHMCPSADRQDSLADNSQTFLFTNIQPQLRELNAGPWEHLEAYARKLAQRGQLLYVVAGGIFSAPFPTIGNGVAVPAANFKIIVVLNQGQGAADVDESTQVLAALMPNQRGVGEREWTQYLTSVDAIEQASGYDFLNAVSERVQRVIEPRVAAVMAR